jgi:hypothetical protein
MLVHNRNRYSIEKMTTEYDSSAIKNSEYWALISLMDSSRMATMFRKMSTIRRISTALAALLPETEGSSRLKAHFRKVIVGKVTFV